MGCFLVLLALLSPRAAFGAVWIFTNRVTIAFDNVLVPLLGLILLPWTALVYTFAYDPVFGVSSMGWAFVFLAFLADLTSYITGGRKGRNSNTGGYSFAPAPHSSSGESSGLGGIGGVG